MKTANGNQPIIKCPHCGWEYVPDEIYTPGEILGKSDTVLRAALGKVIYHDYEEEEEPILVEHFVCDHCGKPFIVEATISYKTSKEEKEKDFSNQYESLLDD